jgi:hypothetical protein
VSLKHLASKLLAGGLSAGIVLIWWPSHYPTTGWEWLTARGVVATLGFELMLLAFADVEDRVAGRLGGRALPVGRLRERVATAPARARTSFVLAAGGAALALPVLALASAGAPPAAPAVVAKPVRVVQPVRTRVVRQVVVKRRVIHANRPAAAPAPEPTAAPDVPPTTTATVPATTPADADASTAVADPTATP